MADYNGWANYATWRVHLEMFDGMRERHPVSAEYCRSMFQDIIEESAPKGSARDYALAFGEFVEWNEIADAVNEYNDFTDEEDDA